MTKNNFKKLTFFLILFLFQHFLLFSQDVIENNENLTAIEENFDYQTDEELNDYFFELYNKEKEKEKIYGGKKFSLAINILDPILKSALISTSIYLNEKNPSIENRVIAPSIELNSQFLVDRYVSLSLSGSFIPELISNPFYVGNENKYWSDSSKFYDVEETQELAYNGTNKYLFNSYFIVDLAVKVLPFGEGLHEYKGFYIKAGLYLGIAIYDDLYFQSDNKPLTNAGSFSSEKIPFFYPIFGKKDSYYNNLISFIAGIKGGIGWQFTFKNGFYLDLGLDISYDGTRKMVAVNTKDNNTGEEYKKALTGLNWFGNFYMGYAW